MARLVTFGCSYTCGFSLPDMIDNYCGICSQLSWPTLLSNKLERDLLNLARPGAGNKEILIEVLNTKFIPDDLVIVAWTHFVRHDLFGLKSFSEGKRLTKSMRHVYKKALLGSFEHDKDWLHNLQYTNLLTIQHCDLYLKDMSINVHHLVLSGELKNDTVISQLKIRNFIDISISDFEIDKAYDNAHPGVESNKLLANLIYDKIKQ